MKSSGNESFFNSEEKKVNYVSRLPKSLIYNTSRTSNYRMLYDPYTVSNNMEYNSLFFINILNQKRNQKHNNFVYIYRVVVIVVRLVFQFDQLLSRFDFFQRDALRWSSRFSHSLCVSLSLCLALFISYWGYERSENKWLISNWLVIDFQTKNLFNKI